MTELEELKLLKDKIAQGKLVEMELEFQNTIEHPPISPQQLYGQACSNDEATINHWRDVWVKQVRDVHKKFGPFADRSIGKFYKSFNLAPAVIAGSGPSLAKNGHLLANRPEGMPLISCLHNFHYFEDRDVKVDFYVSLDAGPVVTEEVYEGGKHDEEWYWERTKDRVLIAYIGTHPSLLEKWRGEVYFYNCPVPDKQYEDACDELEKFRVYMSTGGNVLGACLYFAKAWLGCNPIAFVGADFCFSYTKKFHGWDSKYDKTMGHVVKAWDVFGNKVSTWQSYANFKAYFEAMACNVLGIYVNCSEGGTLGSYPEGNIAAIKQMRLAQFLDMYLMPNHIAEQATNPEEAEKKLLF